MNGRPRWTADLPEVQAGGWNFAQLFVNDQRRFRPVLPAAGWHTIAGKLEPSPANVGKGHDRFAFAGDDLRPDWANLGDVEVVATHRWTMSRLPIGAIEPNPDDPATKIVTFAGRTRAPVEWCSFPKGNRFLVENVKEALGEPGSWYLDRPTGTLTYCPRDGELPTGSSVIAPWLDRLVELRGDVAAGTTVAHLRFEGLTFAHGNWTLPAGGQSYPQAEVNVAAAITATAARQAAGQDEGSIVADPKCKDPAAGDFTLGADSPALPLGFEPLDPAAAGRRSPESLTADRPEVPSLWIRP